MEVMAGRNKSMTNSLLPGNANHTLSHSVYSEDWGRDKERSQRASFCEEWGVFWWGKNRRLGELEIFGPTPATVESS